MNTLTNTTVKHITIREYTTKLMISRRTYGSMKRKYGADIMRGIFDTMTESTEKGLKRKKLYDTFKKVVLEDTLDLIWEKYIEKVTGIENISEYLSNRRTMV